MSTGKLQRNTRQRQVILEELQKLTSHPTAPDLYGIVRKRLPKISLGTVYRNLELLTRHNVIKKLDLRGSVAHFDGNSTLHYHVRCSCCDQVDDLYELPEISLPATTKTDKKKQRQKRKRARRNRKR